MTASERTPHVHAEVIRAYADGHEIEWSTCPDGSWWQAIEIPTFFSSYFYRVKPTPPPEPKTWYQVVFFKHSRDEPEITTELYTSIEEFNGDQEFVHPRPTAIKLIPVFTEE